MNLETLYGKTIAINEGDRVQVDLGKIFKKRYKLFPSYLSTLPNTLMEFIDAGIDLLVAHPEVNEQHLLVAASKKIPVVAIRGRKEFEGDGDGKMFELFTALGLPIVDKTIYLNSRGYLIETFAAKIVEALANQL